MRARLDLVGIVTDDLPRSLAFYRELGIDVPDAPADAPHVEVTLPGGVRLAWDPLATIRSFDPQWSRATGSPGVSLAFVLDSPADVDAMYERLTALGAQHGHRAPFDAPWGQRYALVRDPDGNAIDLFAALP